ncbi:SUKH-4 family immunity protein [Streptomyces sp. NPDC091290]|uniref:SUKH-4 family immunity protein n=1 Tax=Streptomyces sp. NPDC091290 TaxID=3365990 RepID=UPI003821EE1C
MSDSTPATERLAPDQAVARVCAWWGEGAQAKGHLTVVGFGGGGAAVLEEVRRQIPASVMVDATGADAEGVLRRALSLLGVPDDAFRPYAWDRAAFEHGAGKLVLIAHTARAGLTRRSAQPLLVLEHVGGTLAAEGLSVVLDTLPSVMEGSPFDRPCVRLDGIPSDVGAAASRSLPIRSLALSEPRRVPWEVWSELVRAAGSVEADETALRALSARFPDVLVTTDDDVAFIDESVADALRRDTSAELSRRVNSHMVAWLRGSAPRLRHPDGWAASGPLGRYAAHGLAMHAVQAGEFDTLLRDGQVLANLPQSSFLDAAHCAHDGSVPDTNAAADAVHLHMYGVNPAEQGEWAAWLHLMATARHDTELCTSIERAGVELPWKVRWTHWRPPGGYDPSYLKPGPVSSLFDVRWHGRPAIVSSTYPHGIHVWDAETGDLLAGPWYGDDLPAEATAALTWPTAPGQAPPTTRKELRAFNATEEGPDHEFLPALLRSGRLTVLAGPDGLFAVEGASPAPLPGPPLLGTKTAAGPALLTDATTTTAAALPQLFSTARVLRTPPESLPPGLTDVTARRVLTDIGLPTMEEKGIRLEPDYDGFLWELPWTEGLQPAAETGPFFRIGLWSGAELVVDGPTGHVLRMPRSTDESGLDGYLVATDLDRFLAMVTWWITGRRILNTIENRDEEQLFRQHIEDAVWIIDNAGSRAKIWTYALYNG